MIWCLVESIYVLKVDFCVTGQDRLDLIEFYLWLFCFCWYISQRSVFHGLKSMADPLNPCKCQSDFSVVEFTVRCKIAFFPSENSHVFQFKQDFYLEKKRWLCFFFLIFSSNPLSVIEIGCLIVCLAHTQNLYELLIFCFGIIELIFSRSWRNQNMVRGRSMILSYGVWVLLHSPYSFMKLAFSSTLKVGKKTLLRVKQMSSIFLAGSFLLNVYG